MVFLTYCFCLSRGTISSWQKSQLSPSGNRTPVFRVTGGDTVHYTNEDGCMTFGTSAGRWGLPDLYGERSNGCRDIPIKKSNVNLMVALEEKSKDHQSQLYSSSGDHE